MGRYLEIADQALSESEIQPLTESDSKVSSPTHCEKSELCEKSPFVQVHVWRRRLLRESRDELRQAAGDDWAEFSVPAKIIGFADSLAIAQIRESGGIPSHYTTVANCSNCGEVPVPPGTHAELGACSWCMNGITAPKDKH